MSTPRLPASNGHLRAERPPGPLSDWENFAYATAGGGQTVILDGCRPASRVRPSDSRSVDNGGNVDSAGEYYCGDYVPGKGAAIVRTTVAAVSLILLLHALPASGKSSARGGHTAMTDRGVVATTPRSVKSGHAATGRSRFGLGGALVGFGGGRGFGFADEEHFLIVDATPSEAEVFLDGRSLGSAGEVLARALALPPGQHTVAIVAKGFRPYVARFVADPSFPIRIRAALEPE